MDKEFGELLSIKYNSIGEAVGGWTAYPPLSNLIGTNFEVPMDKDEKMEKSRVMILRYDIE